MTRDHDIKRAIRARMKATGERYTVARSALVAPSPSAAETSPSRGGHMASVPTDLLDELDERGFAVIRSFAPPGELEQLTTFVDDVVAAVIAGKQEEDRQRRAAGETGWINVWHPGVPGWIAKDVTSEPQVARLVHDPRLLDIAAAATGAGAAIRRIRVIASMPGYGHEGFHPDADPDQDTVPAAIGAWRGVAFSLLLSPHRGDSGTVRALPGSHRTRPRFEGLGSVMPPHPDEVRMDADPGDLFVYSADLWKSATFNSGHDPLKSLWLGPTLGASVRR